VTVFANPGLALFGCRAMTRGRERRNRTNQASWSSRGDAGSSYKQAKAKIRRFEIEEVAIAFGPPTGCEVITETPHCPLLGVRPDSGPHRYSATNALVEICLRPASVRLEEAVNAVPRKTISRQRTDVALISISRSLVSSVVPSSMRDADRATPDCAGDPEHQSNHLLRVRFPSAVHRNAGYAQDQQPLRS
jgi:hypothetical protein